MLISQEGSQLEWHYNYISTLLRLVHDIHNRRTVELSYAI